MNTIERVIPISQDGVELYVSHDGTQCGCSQTGLARLCGMSRAAIQKVLSDSKTLTRILGSSVSENLETLTEAELSAATYLEISSNQHAKIIRSEVVAKIISYYAFKALNKNETAQFSLEKFASIGIDTWIKKTVGYIETHGNTESKLFEMLAIMGQDIKEMKADLASTSGYRAARITLPGLKEWMEALDQTDKEQLALPSRDEELLFTLSEWADLTNQALTKSQKHALANIISSTYKLMALEMPQKVNRHNEKGYRLAAVQAYPERHFTLIQMCFSKLVSSR
jgi:hypothetical protein